MSENLEDVVRGLASEQRVLATKMETLTDNVNIIAKGFHGLKDHVLAQPKQSTIGDQLKLIGVTLAIYTAVLGLANQWWDSRAATTVQTLSRIERSADDLTVMKYRLELLENRKAPSSG